MKLTRLFFFTLGLVLIAGQCMACGGDPCQRSGADFEVPCRNPDYIAPEYGNKDILRILLTHYLQRPESTRRYEEMGNVGIGFPSYQTQINALLAQKHLPPLNLDDNYNPYDTGTGGCQSNNYATALELAQAIAADPDVTAGYSELFILRNDLVGLCGEVNPQKREKFETAFQAIYEQWPQLGGASFGISMDRKQSRGPGSYPDYLGGLIAFYGQDYEKALKIFDDLSMTGSRWLRETSSYLLGRTRLIAAQKDYNGYDRRGVDQQQLNAAPEAFAAYLQQYPQGRYAESAIGLKRRILTLQKKNDLLNAELLRQFSPYLEASEQQQICDNRCQNLTIEFFNDYKPLLPVPYETPVIAAYTLMALVTPTEDLLNELESHQAAFTSYPGLFQLTRNVLLYRLGRYQQLADTFAVDDAGEDDITVGNQVFLACALEKLQQHDRARAVWRAIAAKHRSYAFTELDRSNPFALQRLVTAASRATDNYLQVAQARNYLLASEVPKLAEPGSGITDSMLLENCFYEVATKDDLEAIIADESVASAVSKQAQATLMNRLLFEKRYDEFVEQLKQLKEPGIYTQVRTAATMLQKDPNNPKGLLNIGYFLASHRIKPKSQYDEMASMPYRFSKLRVDRPKEEMAEPPFRYYQKALSQFGPQDRGEDEAKLLHYMILSFKRDNDAFFSTWGLVKDQENKGKEWLDRLKSKYPRSKWTKKTKYYY
jgi:hypothetical protein